MDLVRCDFAMERQCHTMNDPHRMYVRFRNCSTNVLVFANDFEIAEPCSFLLFDCQGAKALVRLDFAK